MSKTVLIVDDEETIRSLVGLILKNQGYDVIEAFNGNDALEKLRANRVAMVITDYIMPGMNGIHFIKELRKVPEWRTIPVIMISGSTEQLNREFMELGINEYIMKPFLSKRLTAVVSNLLNKENLIMT